VNPGWARFCQTVAARGDHPALLMGDQVVSLVDLGRKARRAAAALVAQGVGPGDRVILRLPNGVDAMALPAAIWAVGAVPVLVPLDLQPAALADIAARTSPRLTLTEAPEGEAEHLGSASADVGSIVFTSGSTGRPKGVVQRQETLIDGAERVAQAVGFGPDDRLLSAVPWSHDYGWTQLLALYALGVTLVLPAIPGLAGLPEAMERHRATVLGGVPSVYAGLTRGVSDLGTRDRSSVRVVMSTGSAMPQRIWDDLGRMFPQARRVLNYGLTETFRSATLRAGDEGLAPRLVGSALQGAGLAIVGPEGQVRPAGEWGEIVHRGAGVFEGYWDDPDQTALRRRVDPVTGQGWAVFTGDRGMLDDAGRLTVGDRLDRMVKVMGLAASPLAIETVLRAVPGVDAAAVVFRPHDTLGSELHAFVVGEGTQKVAEEACRAVLAPHERPRRFHRVDALPLTASGKVDLVALTQEIAG
jgi:long-chain acyl-CoA synthetase